MIHNFYVVYISMYYVFIMYCRVLGAPVGSWDLKQGDKTELRKKWREIPGRESMCWASPGVTWPRVLNPLSNSWRFSDSSM
jgi:hypothetical protein